MLASNLIFWLVSKLTFPPDKVVTLSASEINKGLFLAVCIMIVGLLITMHFNAVFNRIYDEVRSINNNIEGSIRDKEAFFTMISHEIRNPLQSLLGSIELLQDTRIPKTTVSSLLEICKNCCQTVLNLVSNILDMSKLAADKMQLSPGAADLRELVNRIIRITMSKAQAKHLELVMLDDKSLPPNVELDSQRIEQVMLNVVSNAIKFTNKGKVAIKLQWFPLEDNGDSNALVSHVLEYSSWEETMTLDERIAENPAMIDEKYTRRYKPSFEGKNTVSASRSEVFLDAEGEARGEYWGVAKIEVMDTGIGISKESVGKLFKPYQQANSTISKYKDVSNL